MSHPAISTPRRRSLAASHRHHFITLVVALAASCALSLFSPHLARAEEPSAPAVAAALENLLVDSIARSEKSVVAIARVDPETPSAPLADGAPAAPLGPRLRDHFRTPAPGDHDFVADGYGTGVIVNRRGLILTNYHLLGLKSQHYVTTSERKVYPARIKAADPRSDLAVLEIEASDLSPIALGDAAKLKKGQVVVSLGNPYAIASDGQASASWGIISNLGRKVGPAADEDKNSQTDRLFHHGMLIQTDAKLNLGTSGGALLNLKGEMIGLTTSLAATAGYEQAAGYAVPVDETFRRVVDALKEGREVEYGFLGVEPENLGQVEIRRGLHGARIGRVEAGAPAERSGLRAGDVITRINNRPIYDADGLMLEIGRQPVDATVQLTLLRDGEETPLAVELSKYPVHGAKVITNQPPSWRGLRVDYATALPADKRRPANFPLDPEGCVIVRDVEPGTPAAAADLQVGMLISQVGHTPIRSPRQFSAAIAAAEKDGDVSLRICSNSETPDIRTIKK